ncbi:MAG: alpha/beta fold hydrolase [Methyloligellaceae bacterium]
MTMWHVSTLGPEQAEPIVFLHGAGYTGAMWREITGRLSDMRTIVPDLPGHGRSIQAPFVSFEAAADALAELIGQKAAGGPVHLVGVSLGSYIGFRLIQRHPGLVARAVLSGFHVIAMPRPVLMRLLGDVMSPLAATAWFRRRMARSLGVPDDLLGLDGSDVPRVSARALRAANRGAVDFRAPEGLSRIRTPVLAVAGEREHATIVTSLGVLEREMPNCVARVAPGLGHAWCAEDPDLFAATVRAWTGDERLPAALTPA